MSYPAAVDLRSDIDTVYQQGSDRSCGPHAIANALDCMYDRAGKPRRHSRHFVWWWSQFWFRGYASFGADNVGSTIASLERALHINGTMTDAEWAQVTDRPPAQGSVPSLTLVRTSFGSLDELKRRLCLGIPVVLLMVIHEGFYRLGPDWRTHTWATDTPQLGEHFVSIVGYDDAAQRLLVENSWDATWGDGGFFGFPYSMVFDPGVMQGYCHIDRIPGLTPKPADNYTPEPPMYLTPTESIEFVDRAKDALKDRLMQALAAGDVPGIIAECKRWGVSDKHLEMLMGWPRGAVWGFHNEHPDYDWAGFAWDQR